MMRATDACARCVRRALTERKRSAEETFVFGGPSANNRLARPPPRHYWGDAFEPTATETFCRACDRRWAVVDARRPQRERPMRRGRPIRYGRGSGPSSAQWTRTLEAVDQSV